MGGKRAMQAMQGADRWQVRTLTQARWRSGLCQGVVASAVVVQR